MKKKRAASLPVFFAGLFMLLFIASGLSFADPPPLQPVKPHFPPKHPMLPLPDLSVEDIRLDNECRVVVRIRNNGPGRLPDKVWTVHKPKSASVYLSVNGNGWGGETIWKLDPYRALQVPGGTVEYTSNLKVTSPSNVKAQIDMWNDIAESYKGNNTAARSLACANAPGDLQVKIQGCPFNVKAGQELGSSFNVWVKNSFGSPLNNITVDLVLTSAPSYPVPAPYATYSPHYYSGVLLKGGRENISFAGSGVINVKLNGSNTIPADTPPGIYYLAAVVDAGNKANEMNEHNNVAYCKIKVLPGFVNVPHIPLQPLQPPVQPIHPIQPVHPVQPSLIKEDCISFNPNNIEVRELNGRWKIVDGNHWMFDFDNRKDEAFKAFNIIKHYGMNSTCYVGRPNASFTYLLVSGNAPQGPFPGEDAISFNPNTIEVKEIGGSWKIVDGSQWMFDFGANKAEAVMTFNIIKKYGFRYSCYVGRPNPSFMYMRK